MTTVTYVPDIDLIASFQRELERAHDDLKDKRWELKAAISDNGQSLSFQAWHPQGIFFEHATMNGVLTTCNALDVRSA